jgi:plastocyanin
MKRTRMVALAGAIVVAVILSLGTSASAKARTATVDVDDDFFTPTFLEVKEDTKVEWNWVGVGLHDVTKESGPGKFFESGPKEGSGVLYSRTFRKPGKYAIICSVHTTENMRMDLKVKRRRRN